MYKKISSLIAITSIVSACAKTTKTPTKKPETTKTVENNSYISAPTVKRTNTNSEIVENSEITKKISYINSFIEKNIDKTNYNLVVDNPYLANWFNQIGIKISALPNYSVNRLNKDLFFKLQKFNSAEYDCKPFSEAIYKNNACYINDKVVETIKPRKLEKYGRRDYRVIYNLGDPNKIDKEQIKKSKSTIVFSVLNDDINLEYENIAKLKLSFNYLSDYYVLLQTFGKQLAQNSSQVDKEIFKLKETIEKVEKLRKLADEGKNPQPIVQFVYVDEDGKLYKPSFTSFLTKFAKDYNFDLVALGKKETSKVVNEKAIFGNGSEILDPSKDLIADKIIFINTTFWSNESIEDKINKIYAKNFVWKDQKHTLISDISFINQNFLNGINKATSFIFNI